MEFSSSVKRIENAMTYRPLYSTLYYDILKLSMTAAYIIENAEKRLLIAKRNSKVADGIWEFPGGKIEEGETPQEALIREIREELGLRSF